MKLLNENYFTLYDEKNISLGYIEDIISDKSYLIIRIRHTEYIFRITVSIILNILIDSNIDMSKIKLNRKEVYKITSSIDEVIEDKNLLLCSKNIFRIISNLKIKTYSYNIFRYDKSTIIKELKIKLRKGKIKKLLDEHST